MADAKETVFIKLPGARLSFPRLWTPKAFSKTQKPRFEASFLLDPSNEVHAKVIKKIKAEFERVVSEKWNGKTPPKLKKCFGLADENEMTYDGYEGMFYVASAHKNRPKIIDRDRSVLTEADGKPYGGCYVNGLISLWAWEFVSEEGGKQRGVNANLHAVQYDRKGEAFGAKPIDEEEHFDALDPEESDADDEDSKDTGWDD